MQLVLTEDQELLAKTAADFVAEQSPVSRMRALRDAADPDGFSRPLWKQMAELGWVGIPFPESVGGADMGLAELAVVLEELGRKLAPEPFLSNALLAGQAILRAGSEAQQRAWLPGLVSGEKLLSLAYQERDSRFALERVATRAEREGSGWRLSGEKIAVLDGASADAFVVAARTDGADDDPRGISLFLLPRDTEGLSVVPQARVDARRTR
jgi:alkylation response protein AidB-like acyl-CoA dehydrogenase